MHGYSKRVYSASEDFYAAHRKAKLRELLAYLTGRQSQLLSFDEVSHKFKFQGSAEKGTQDIPLASIVGSVGRYLDFTRDFLPLNKGDRERWSGVLMAMMSMEGVPPIDVYQMGEVYFVKDGNHRVSVARQMGATHIQANVVEVRTSVALTPDISPDELILRAEYAEFLDKTHLDVLRPGADLTVTAPGAYPELLQQIDLHYYDLILEHGPDTPYPQAVRGWYDQIYLPTVQIIRAQDALRAFPGRTETDIYLSITSHRAELEESLRMEARPENAAADLLRRVGPPWARVKRLVFERTRLYKFEDGPPPGRWRRQASGEVLAERPFKQILVALNGQTPGWTALKQAALVARREGGQIHGLHVLNIKDKQRPPVEDLQQQFRDTLNEAGADGQLVVSAGNINQQITARTELADLLVIHLNHPPALRGLARLRSGLRDLIRRAPCPILITPHRPSPLSKALLAYDGSPRADEGLYLAAMLARRWQIPLVVLHVAGERSAAAQPLERARHQLEEHGVQAEYVSVRGLKVQNILLTCEEHACDFIITGGYGHTAPVEVFAGSTLDKLLLYSRLPVLVCH